VRRTSHGDERHIGGLEAANAFVLKGNLEKYYPIDALLFDQTGKDLLLLQGD